MLKTYLQNSISLIPSVPPGASLFSRYVLFHIMSGNADIMETKKLLYSSPKGKKFDVLVSELPKVFGIGPYSHNNGCRRLDRGETLYSLYQALLEIPSSQFLKFGPNRTFRAATHDPNSLFFCAKCIEEDVESFGIAYWKTIHQAVFVRACPSHLQVLLVSCAECGAKQVSKTNWRLPTKECFNCHQNHQALFDDHYVKDAYILFVRWCEDILFDRFSIDIEQQIRDDLEALFGIKGLRSAENLFVFFELFSAQYGVRSFIEFQEIFGIRIPIKVINKLVLNELGEIKLAEKLVIAGALRSYILRSTLSLEQNHSYDVGLGLNLPYSINEIVFKIGRVLGIEHDFLEWVCLGIGNASDARKVCPWNQEFQFNTLLKSIKFRGSRSNRSGKKYSIQQAREEIMRLVGLGLVTRKQLRKVADSLVRNALVSDRDWLDQNVPLNIIPVGEKVAYHRNVIKQFLKENPSLPTSKIEIFVGESYRWCRKNDYNWIMKVIFKLRKKNGD